MGDSQPLADLDAQIDALDTQIKQLRRTCAQAQVNKQEKVVEDLADKIAILEREIDQLWVQRARLVRRPYRHRSS